MANWPAALPQKMFLGTQIGDDETRLITPMDSGPSSMRNRFTARTQTVKTNMVLTGSQLAIFQTFYRTTLNNGASSFTWTDPTDGNSVTIRFKTPTMWTCVKPDLDPDSRIWQSTLDLEIQP
jgi:hypothetical protein